MLVLGHHLSFGMGSLFTLGEHLALDASLSCRTLFPTSIDGFGINGTVIGAGWTLRVGPALSF